jgi:uncharacterized membrane protein YciS (DUF1049 family)
MYIGLEVLLVAWIISAFVWVRIAYKCLRYLSHAIKVKKLEKSLNEVVLSTIKKDNVVKLREVKK